MNTRSLMKANVKFKRLLVGAIRPTRSGLNTAWIRCPLRSALAIAKKGKIRIGWTMVKAELLRARPVQCYRCRRIGHTVKACKSDIDYSKCCFKCGRKGHTANLCQHQTRCILCMKMQKNNNHRVGSPQCEGARDTDVRKKGRYLGAEERGT